MNIDGIRFIGEGDAFDDVIGWARTLSYATECEPSLLFQPAEKLQKMAEGGRIILVTNQNNSLVGSVALWDIGGGWNEIGTVYIATHYRCHGIGQRLLRHAFETWNGQRILSTTKNSLYMHIAIKSGMVAVTSDGDMQNVVPLTCVCGLVDDVPDPQECRFRDGDCVFLISEITAQRISHIVRADVMAVHS